MNFFQYLLLFSKLLIRLLIIIDQPLSLIIPLRNQIFYIIFVDEVYGLEFGQSIFKIEENKKISKKSFIC
jgi:hypothetical protein